MNEQNLDFLFKNQDKLEKIETKVDNFIKQNLFINNCKKNRKILNKIKKLENLKENLKQKRKNELEQKTELSFNEITNSWKEMGKINEKLIILNKKINDEKSNDNYFNNKEKNSDLKEFETFDYLIKDEIYLLDLQNQSIISRHKTDSIKM